MAEYDGQRALERAIDKSVDDARGAERYEQRQRAARNGSAKGADVARPLEFDARGFPVPQRPRTFFGRLTRQRSLR